MGCIFALANPDVSHGVRRACRKPVPPSACPRLAPAEQGIGSGAVGSGAIAVRGDPRNLGFEQRDSLSQFGLRIGGEVFAREAARCIAPGPRQIGIVHLGAASQGNGLAVNP
jgi:hypothetical protein